MSQVVLVESVRNYSNYTEAEILFWGAKQWFQLFSYIPFARINSKLGPNRGQPLFNSSVFSIFYILFFY